MPTAAYHHSDEALDELFLTMVQLGRTVVKQYIAPGESGGHGLPRHMALRAIAGMGDCKAGDIAQLLGIKAPAASALIDGLEREGLVVREHSVEDKRVVLIRPTEAGLTALKRFEERRRAVMRERLGVLSDEDVAALIRIQKTLIGAMADGGSPACEVCERNV
jgi:DNA-binding MarR family transcriptional regulator